MAVLDNIKMKILNLYAGIGGNRKFWKDCDVTAVEIDPKIAAVYQSFYPKDEVIVSDAHQFLLENFAKYDFIWSSPPCQSHSRMTNSYIHKRKPPDPILYQQIEFLQHNCSGKFVVENVIPYYTPIIAPTQRIGRHLFWSNFYFMSITEPKLGGVFKGSGGVAMSKKIQEWLGMIYLPVLYYENNHDPAQIARNCVHPLIGAHIFNSLL